MTRTDSIGASVVAICFILWRNPSGWANAKSLGPFVDQSQSPGIHQNALIPSTNKGIDQTPRCFHPENPRIEPQRDNRRRGPHDHHAREVGKRHEGKGAHCEEPTNGSPFFYVEAKKTKRDQPERNRNQVGQHPERSIIDREIGPDVYQEERNRRG